jgi:hypothetical protein
VNLILGMIYTFGGLGATYGTSRVTAYRLFDRNGDFTTRKVNAGTGVIFFASASNKYGTTLRCWRPNGLIACCRTVWPASQNEKQEEYHAQFVPMKSIHFLSILGTVFLFSIDAMYS